MRWISAYGSNDRGSAQRVRMLKAATGQRCECCGRMVGAHVLELHCIPGMADHLRDRDATSHILVLCPGCHASHAYP
ncbi:MAG: hypothetical protein IPI71_00035 [Methanolinea sp.]|nr:MAG: hypothetical protein IPI71_00035 [Methanolinea sp.]